MITITKEFTKEQLQQIIETDHVQCGEASSLARIALASLEAEAVAWLWSHRKHPSEVSLVRPEDDERAEGAHWSGWSCQALYAAQPASAAMKEHQIRELVNELRDIAVEYHGTQQLRERIARTIRAAMLQGADGKPELTVWYGSMPESNGKANWTAILHRKGEGRCMDGFTIDRSEYPGRVLYAADRVRYLIGEKSERPSILDYDADAHSGYVKTGNSPVIPECSCHACRPVTFADSRFVVCPECGNKRCPHANDHRNACTGSNEPGQEGSAYPAAPQQEA
ncbi:hypothetical protein [Enterobacter roggenkampii]|uniref:hypothetical protein n=2 Tax=Enterobacter roggenkampii TaxID=1812935 RepID=UPI003D6F0557